MQERLTKQIAVAVTQAVQPAGVAVIIEGENLVRLKAKPCFSLSRTPLLFSSVFVRIFEIIKNNSHKNHFKTIEKHLDKQRHISTNKHLFYFLSLSTFRCSHGKKIGRLASLYIYIVLFFFILNSPLHHQIYI